MFRPYVVIFRYYSYNYLDIGFFFPYTGQCLHVGKMLTYMYALLSEFVLYKVKLL
jgi:hypothetical protein